MYPLIKAAYCMLKKRKLQSVLIGLMLLLTTVLLYTGIGIMTTESPFEQMFKRANASHTQLESEEGLYDTKTLVSLLNSQSAVENVNLYATALIPAPIKINDRLVNEGFKLSEFIEGSGYDILYDENNMPCKKLGDRELWINTSTASNLNIEVGDHVSLLAGKSYINFTITHIVTDPIYSSGMFSPSRVWASKGTIATYFNDNKHISLIGIHYKNYSEKIELETLRNFKKSLSGGYLGYINTYPVIKSLFTITTDITSALLVSTAIIMLIVVMLIISNTINNVVLNKYKSIGVMKALGYSSKEIIWIFVFQFLMLLTLQMPLGLILGNFTLGKLLTSITRALHIPMTGNTLYPLLLTIVTLFATVCVFTFFSAQKAGKVKPVQAIKYGMPESKRFKTNFKVTRWTKLPLTTLFVLKQVLGNKKHTIFQILVFSISVFLAVLILSISTSFNNKNTVMYYVGMASGDMNLSPDESVSYDALIKDLRQMKGVEALATYVDNSGNGSAYSKHLDDYVILSGVTILEDAEAIGFLIKEGHFPHTSNEALITQYASELLGKTLGDYMEIQTNSGLKKYLITGTYETVFNNGQEYVISSNPDPSNPIKASNTTIKLKLSRPYSEVEAQLKEQYGTTIGIEKEDFASSKLKNTTQKVTSVLLYVSIVFLVVCGFAIFNWTLMDIKNASKMYGILKANGMNNLKIILILLVKSWTITIIGCAIGILLSVLLASPFLIFFISFGFKLSSFVITVPWHYALLTSVLFIATSTISTLIPGMKIGKITPRILIIE